MKRKTHSISRVIDAGCETLFNVVSDFENYSVWNTIIPSGKGKLTEGNELQLLMKMDGKTKPFNPKVVDINEGQSFLLSKVLLSKSIGELSHLFEFKDLGNNRTEFVQT